MMGILRILSKLILPCVIVLGASLAVVRTTSVVTTLSTKEVGVAFAGTEPAVPVKGEETDSKKAALVIETSDSLDLSGASEVSGEAEVSDSAKKKEPPEEPSPAEMEVLKQLAERREQLDMKAKDLEAKETLLEAIEARIDKKIQDMETMRKQLQALLNQAGGQQQAQLDNLVKIYETMKPEEAARIFDTMEMPIVLGVIQKMKSAKSAAIMAKMSSERAKEITTELMRRDKLPSLD